MNLFSKTCAVTSGLLASLLVAVPHASAGDDCVRHLEYISVVDRVTPKRNIPAMFGTSGYRSGPHRWKYPACNGALVKIRYHAGRVENKHWVRVV